MLCNRSEKTFNAPLYSIQQTLLKLEQGGLLVSFTEGKTRIFRFNPRYPFLKELILFLKKSYSFLPEEIKQKYYKPICRKRPRRTGKPFHKLRAHKKKMTLAEKNAKKLS